MPELEIPRASISTENKLEVGQTICLFTEPNVDSYFSFTYRHLNNVRIAANRYFYKVWKVSDTSLVLQYEREDILSFYKPLSVLLALPRPRMLKKIIQTLAVLPVSELIVFESSLSDKSYWLSHELKQERIVENLKYGVKQSGIPFFPKIHLIKDQNIVFSELSEDLAGYRVLGDSNAEFSAIDLCSVTPKHSNLIMKNGICLCIGPERGFTEKERNELVNKGFNKIKLGIETYQVDTAVIAMSSQLNFIHSFHLNQHS